jgi:transposase InsO family protein
VQRFHSGESATSICTSLGKSRNWLYKWLRRYDASDPDWSQDASRRPNVVGNRTPADIEECVKSIRSQLQHDDLFCGAQAILWEMEDAGIEPLPSLRSINRILVRNGMVSRSSRRYVPKGTQYPALPSRHPNQTHQADFVGPCYLTGPLRFYSLNVIDTATARCSLHPGTGVAAANVVQGLWTIWQRIGIPQNIQVDNASCFFGSRKFPRGMGALIRLCLKYGVEPWFVPQAEPWRNGMVESLNERYQQRFLGKVNLTSLEDLRVGSLAFEERHNSRYRFGRLKGLTPVGALEKAAVNLRFPAEEELPVHPLDKPEAGKYHLVRFIRSDRQLDLWGEKFTAPPETEQQYVIATVDVEKQKLNLFLDHVQVDQHDFKLR